MTGSPPPHNRRASDGGLSSLALIGALVSILFLATAAVLFMSFDTQEGMQRLALLFGLFGIAVPAIVGLIKVDQAARQTDTTSSIATALNGQFDNRVQLAAQRANEATAAGVTAPAMGSAGTGSDTALHEPATAPELPI